MRDTRRGYRDYCGVDGRAGIGERSRVGRGEGEDAAGGDDHRAGAGRSRARSAGTPRAVPARRGRHAATPAARARPHPDTGHAGLSLPHLFDHLPGAVPRRVSRPRLCAPMHLVARDREPPERHGPHPADALLVAAGRLSSAAPDRMGDRAKIGYCCAAAALAVACFLAYDAIPDLPLAPQSDEPKKAYFVLAGLQDFLQPLLLLKTVRLANLIARYTDQLAVVELGRTVAAMFGGLTVLATIVLAHRVV